MKKIAVLIPVFNNLAYTQNCLKNLWEKLEEAQLTPHFPIIVIDDGSKDGTGEWVTENYPKVNLLTGDGNLWWSGGINLGAKHAIEVLKCEYVLLWNNDIEIEVDYFKKCTKLVDSSDESIILGSKIYADSNKQTIWSMGGYFRPGTGKFGMYAYMVPESPEYQKPLEVDWITGMGTLVPTEVIKTIGYWDAENFPQYHGDTEFTLRAKLKGFKNLIMPDLTIWNDVTNTGMSHGGKLKKLFQLLSNKRSLYNWKVNMAFLRRYAKGPVPYLRIYLQYAILFGGFIKWKTLSLFGLKSRN